MTNQCGFPIVSAGASIAMPKKESGYLSMIVLAQTERRAPPMLCPSMKKGRVRMPRSHSLLYPLVLSNSKCAISAGTAGLCLSGAWVVELPVSVFDECTESFNITISSSDKTRSTN